MTATATAPPAPAPPPPPRHGRLYWAAADTGVMIVRSLRQVARQTDGLLIAVILPVTLMLLFVYVFGGAISTGTDAYIDYVVPGIILLCSGYGAALTAVSVTADMTEGVIDRFRTLPIMSSAVLIGHVVASLLRNTFSTLLVLGTALLMGFDPKAGPLEWLGAAGVLLLFVLAMSWLSVVFGLLAKSQEAAGGFTFFVLFLPYVSSAFVPTDTMPAALAFFAENQPITPVTESVRALLMGTPIDGSLLPAIAWLTGITVVSYTLATTLFRRRAAR
ncbi:ABC-2 type transport system permease protein [Murinocardiopsis flavida]|uniref:Transport permease protein n=1 Tax=Murinocardiopsis flavida TaxID=645275 RepID=A0A2P8DGF9_9ACTN|nr:ABC transporter permease [Murinocardiopsis flavida]PSK96288.1 ABC-2 type transport system permease protein [Murinocardiopsis flavida]